jgi:hypothetical protein
MIWIRRAAGVTFLLVALLAPASAGAFAPRERLAVSGGEEAIRQEPAPSPWFSWVTSWLVHFVAADNGYIVP